MFPTTSPTWPESSGFGSFLGDGTYDWGTPVTVSATPDTGSHFVNWTGPDALECATGSVLIDGDKSCTAAFALDTHTLTLNAGGVGDPPSTPVFCGAVDGGNFTIHQPEGRLKGDGVPAQCQPDSFETPATGSAGGSSGNSPQATEASVTLQSWWDRYLQEKQAAASGSSQTQATDEVEPEFTAWTWGYEDDPEGELQPPGSTAISAGSEPSSADSTSTDEAKLTWWQRYLLKKQGK